MDDPYDALSFFMNWREVPETIQEIYEDEEEQEL